MAGVTGLEPAASGGTGRGPNQLSYTPSQGCAVLKQALQTVKHPHLSKCLFFLVSPTDHGGTVKACESRRHRAIPAPYQNQKTAGFQEGNGGW